MPQLWCEASAGSVILVDWSADAAGHGAEASLEHASSESDDRDAQDEVGNVAQVPGLASDKARARDVAPCVDADAVRAQGRVEVGRRGVGQAQELGRRRGEVLGVLEELSEEEVARRHRGDESANLLSACAEVEGQFAGFGVRRTRRS